MSKIEVDAIEPQSGTTLTIGASGDSVNIASGSSMSGFTTTDDIAIRGGSDRRITLGSAGTIDANDSNHLRADGTNLKFNSAGGSYIFEQNGTERMRMDSSGNVLIGKTALSNTTQGITLGQDGLLNCVIADAGGASQGIFVNRQDADGTLILFRQANATEGSISVSGATVSYNGFTGSHWSRFIDESKPDVLRGTVMESLDQMTDWYNVEFTDNENNLQKKPYALKANEQEGDVITYNWNTEKQDEEGNDIIEQVQATIVKEVDVKHVMSKISDTVEAKNVYGVFSAWDNDDLINNDFYVASVGSFVVRIKAGQVVSKGDLLQSNGDGTAKVQADDIIRASTFAKVLSNTVIETYEDGSYLVPCSLMC